MTTRLTRSLILSAGIALLVTAIFYWFIVESDYSKKKPKINRYTAELGITFGMPGDTAATPYNVQKSLSIIRERLVRAGYEYEFREEKDKGFTFFFSLLNDTIEVASLITGNGGLAMYEVYTMADLANLLLQADTAMARYLQAKPDDPLLYQPGGNAIQSFLNPLLSTLQPARPYDSTGQPGAGYPGYIGMVAEKDTALLRQLLQHPVAERYWPADNRFLFEAKNFYTSSPGYSLLYAIRNHPPRITNRNIVEAHVEFDQTTNEPAVIMELDNYGGKEFERLTIRNVGKPLAICMNDQVIQAPIVNQPISGGHLRVSSGFGKDAVGYSRAMSILLTSKELPLKVQISQARFLPVSKPVAGNVIYVLLFVIVFAMAMGVQWLIIRLNASK